MGRISVFVGCGFVGAVATVQQLRWNNYKLIAANLHELGCKPLETLLIEMFLKPCHRNFCRV